ncbi:MAG: ATP-binding protein [Myxococcota bacterium]|nr:ATP-binding protein [Myxococcota bacterium]
MIVSIVGPESSGKTSLAEALSLHYGAPWLPEYAREYLEGRPEYTEGDLEEIAREQVRREQSIVEENPEFVILDTDLVVIAVWWQEVFGHVPDWISHHLKVQRSRHYLLVRPDLPWQADPLRVSPHDRDRLFGLYQAFLREEGVSVTEIYGEGPERTQMALSALAVLKPDRL